MNLFAPENIPDLEKRSALLRRKINRLNNALIIETDAAKQFQYEEEIAKCETSLQEVQNMLADAYGMHTPIEQQYIVQQIKNISLEITNTVGIYHLVNCNREQTKDVFWNAFDLKQEKPFQFYFISACPTQMPISFAERMIYELQYEEETILFRLNKGDTNRVKIMDLPIGRNLEICQKKFKKTFAEIFNFRPEESFDNFIKVGIPKLKYDAAAF